MKISSLSKLLLLAVIAVNISGCIVVPAWHVDGRDHDRGDHHYKHHGDHHDKRGGGHDRGGDRD